MSLTTLESSPKWDHAVLAHRAQHTIPKVHPHDCIWQDYLLFYSWLIFHGTYIPHKVPFLRTQFTNKQSSLEMCHHIGAEQTLVPEVSSSPVQHSKASRSQSVNTQPRLGKEEERDAIGKASGPLCASVSPSIKWPYRVRWCISSMSLQERDFTLDWELWWRGLFTGCGPLRKPPKDGEVGASHWPSLNRSQRADKLIGVFHGNEAPRPRTVGKGREQGWKDREYPAQIIPEYPRSSNILYLILVQN